MRIGLIAMSGVRAWSEELNRAGLTMPGVMERGAVIASLPSLSLLTLAGMCGPEHAVSYHEIRDLRAEGTGGLLVDFDLVAISTMTAQVKDAYEVADWYRARGVKVIMGGLHVTALPSEALAHCDAVVVGEAEPVWGRVLADAERGRLAGVYTRGEGEAEFDLAVAPMPRFELLDIYKYNRLTVQTTRGCPHSCAFCASSIMLTRGYKVKPVERVMAEIGRVRDVWPAGETPFIEFADDNSFASRGAARALLSAMAAERAAGRGVSWFTEVDISIAWEPELLALMRASGCRQVLVGLESPDKSGLDGVETRRNWKLRQYSRYEEGVRLIQAAGITVNGCFILGLDGQGECVFDAVAEFAERTSLFDVQITVLTPFPGTPLYAQLEREGRLIEPGAWEKCTLFDVNFVPRGMTVRELEEGFLRLAGRLYHPEAVKGRREGYFRGLSTEGRRRA